MTALESTLYSEIIGELQEKLGVVEKRAFQQKQDWLLG
jgi:hypothetical protein